MKYVHFKLSFTIRFLPRSIVAVPHYAYTINQVQQITVTVTIAMATGFPRY